MPTPAQVARGRYGAIKRFRGADSVETKAAYEMMKLVTAEQRLAKAKADHEAVVAAMKAKEHADE